MTVVVDTNALVQIFGKHSPLRPLKDALFDGTITLAYSTTILLEYEEVVVRLGNQQRWNDISRFIELLGLIHGNVKEVEPSYRFNVISSDSDDNAFVDCAIAAEADFVITSDAHFAPLTNAGFKTQPIKPDEFISWHLKTP